MCKNRTGSGSTLRKEDVERKNTWTNRGHKAGEEMEHQNQKDGRAKKEKRGRGRHRNEQNTQRRVKSERAD